MQKRNSLKSRFVMLDLFQHPCVKSIVFSELRACFPKIVVVVVFVLSISCLHAQNTGFMGKRVIINMGAEFSPVFRNSYVHDQFKYFQFNCILSPNIEVITTKRATAGVVYHHFRTKYEPFWGESEDLTTHGFGVFYKFSIANGKRALVGPYLKAQFDGFFFNCPSYNDEITEMSDRLFAVKVELGKNFLLFNRLHLSSGVSFGVPFGGYKVITDAGKSVSDFAKTRILGAYWFGLTVNIGFLAF